MTRRVLVAIMTVRRSELEAFRAFETIAARVMARHRGAIERTVVAPGIDDATLREVHVVTFPDDASLAAYRADAALAAARDLRDRSVVSTELLLGEDGPTYDLSPAG